LHKEKQCCFNVIFVDGSVCALGLGWGHWCGVIRTL